MANNNIGGIDVRASGGKLLFSALFADSSGDPVSSGTATVRLGEYQDDGTIKSYDFNDNTFKTTSLTTATLSLTHRTMNNATFSTGVWTAVLATLTGFTALSRIVVIVEHTTAANGYQSREFQFGGANGDFLVNGTTLVDIPWNADWDAEVQSEVNDALVVFFGATWAAAVADVKAAVISIDVDGEDLQEALRLVAAVLLGKTTLSGTTRTYRDMPDTKDRIVATTNGTGERSSVSRDSS